MYDNFNDQDHANRFVFYVVYFPFVLFHSELSNYITISLILIHELVLAMDIRALRALRSPALLDSCDPPGDHISWSSSAQMYFQCEFNSAGSPPRILSFHGKEMTKKGINFSCLSNKFSPDCYQRPPSSLSGLHSLNKIFPNHTSSHYGHHPRFLSTAAEGPCRRQMKNSARRRQVRFHPNCLRWLRCYCMPCFLSFMLLGYDLEFF